MPTFEQGIKGILQVFKHMNTGEKIKQHRLLKKISPKDVAAVLDMDLSNYYRIERDEVKPDIENLIKIAEYMQIDPRELLAEERVVFNNTLHDNAQCNNSPQYGIAYQPVSNYDSKVIELLEDKVKLLEEKIRLQEDIITMLRSQQK